MRRLLSNILYKGIPIKQYASVTVGPEISEEVFLKTGDSIIDVTQDQWILCLQPIVFGIWIKKPTSVPFSSTDHYQLIFKETAPQKKLAEIQVSIFDTIEESEGTLLLLKEDRSRVFHTSLIESFLLYSAYYRKPGFSFKKFSSYASAFSYPRRVRIISFQHNNYYSIFPMDFVGKIAGNNRYVFGLRHTNEALSKIIAEKKIVVSEAPFAYKEQIYQLGNYHSSSPPPLDKLPFRTLASKNFGFPVPVWAEKYNEILITSSVNLGSHMLLWGESQHEETVNASDGNLYHIHFLLSLLKARKGTGYTPV
jgi:hypothetical protein